MTEYFYQVGGSLGKNAPTYVERLADQQLYQALVKGEFCYVFNSRQMGKSSLLVQTRKRLEESGYACTTIDLTKIGSENITPSQWYKGIITELWQGFNLIGKFRLKSWWPETENISDLQNLSQFIESVILANVTAEKIFIFVDEIDSILGLDFPVDDFFALIRFCYNQRATNPEYRRLSFALFGVATPSDLIQDKSRTPFNIGTAIDLGGFTLEQAQPLLKKLSAHVSHPEVVLTAILAWTNGQPFLTQKLCKLVTLAGSEMAEGLMIPPGTEGFWVDNLVKEQIIKDWESQDEPEHLRTISDRLLHNQEKASRLLGIYQQILETYPAKPLLERGDQIEQSAPNSLSLLKGSEGGIPTNHSREQTELILSGLVVKQQGYLNVKNRIYQQVFNHEWVTEQLSNLRPYSQTFDAWIASGKTDESRLLRGEALKDAQSWALGKSLSDLDYQFLVQSAELDRKEAQRALEAERTKEIEARLIQQQQTAKFQRLFLRAVSIALIVASGLGITTFWQYRRAIVSQRNESLAKIQSIVRYSEALFTLDRQLDALIEALKARQDLQQQKIKDPNTEQMIELALRRSIYGAIEFNHFRVTKGGITGLDISQDSQTIVTGSDTNILLHGTDGSFLRKWSKHQGPVLAVAIAPNGKILASGSGDTTIKLWDKNGNLLQTLNGHQAPVYDIKFSPDGNTIASASMDQTIKLWRPDGTLLKTLTGHQGVVRQIAFTPDGKTLVSVSQDGTIKLWHTDGIGSLRKTLTEETEQLLSLDFSPDGQLLAVSRGDGKVKLWQFPSGKLLKTISAQTAGVWSVAFHPSGKILASASDDKTIAFWSEEGVLLNIIRAHEASVKKLDFSPDGKILASIGWDGQVKLWRLQNPLLTRLFGHTAGVQAVAYSADGNFMATVSPNETILWQSDGKILRKIPGKNSAFAGVAFSPTENIFAVSAAAEVQLWQTDGKLLKTLKGHQSEIRKLAFSPDGKTIASTSSDKTVKLWSLSGEELATFTGHQAGVWGVAFSPDGSRLGSSGGDSTFRLWQKDGQLLKTLPIGGGIGYSVTTSRNGLWMAIGDSARTLKIWNQAGELISTSHTNNEEIWAIAVSPDDQMIAIGCDSGIVQLLRPNGELLGTLLANNFGIRGLAFSPDGKTLASTGEDRMVILWNLDRAISFDRVLAYGCDWVRDYLRTSVEVEEKDKHLCDGIEPGSKND